MDRCHRRGDGGHFRVPHSGRWTIDERRLLQRGRERVARRHGVSCASSRGPPQQIGLTARQRFQQPAVRSPMSHIFSNRGESGRLAWAKQITYVSGDPDQWRNHGTVLLAATSPNSLTNGDGLASQTLVTNMHGSFVRSTASLGVRAPAHGVVARAGTAAISLHIAPDSVVARCSLSHRRVGLAWSSPSPCRRLASSHQALAAGCRCWASRRRASAGVPKPDAEQGGVRDYDEDVLPAQIRCGRRVAARGCRQQTTRDFATSAAPGLVSRASPPPGHPPAPTDHERMHKSQRYSTMPTPCLAMTCFGSRRHAHVQAEPADFVVYPRATGESQHSFVAIYLTSTRPDRVDDCLADITELTALANRAL